MDHLKAIIRDKLRGSPIVAKLLEERPELQDDPPGLLQFLEAQGLIEDLFLSVEGSLQQQSSPWAPKSTLPDPELARSAKYSTNAASGGKVEAALGQDSHMILRLAYGRAFLDYLEAQDAAGIDLQWHVAFGGQRVKSRFVPAAVDPKFAEAFMLRLPAAPTQVALLQHAVPLQLVLVSTSKRVAGFDDDPPWDCGPGSLLSSHHLEWRHCLASSDPLKLTIELKGVGRRHQLSVGVLHAELEFQPQDSSLLVPEQVVREQLRGEETKKAELMRNTFEDLDRWWAEHHCSFPERHVRLFAQTENCLYLPVCCFVVPLESGRCLDGPGQALRWVSLMGAESAIPEATSVEARWQSFPCLWAQGRAQLEERALLLCSLLLGFSLDAWCCLGRGARGEAYAWVIVRDRGDASTPAEVTCWDPKGIKFSADEPQYLSSYSSVDTVFNHCRMMICRADNAARTSYDFSDSRVWLAAPLDNEALELMRLHSCTRNPPFADFRPQVWKKTWQSEVVEEAVEQRLSAALRAYREAAGLPTRFDPHLAQLLHVALANCEWERNGLPSQATTFQALAKRACRSGEILRAVPVQFNHLKVSLFWTALSSRATVAEVIMTPPSTRFAVRARAVVLPEKTIAVWVMIAALGQT